MLKQQKKSIGYVPKKKELLFAILRISGYDIHDGPRYLRENEIATLRKTYTGKDGLRQNHVQIVERGSTLAIYAHTEPHTKAFLDHIASAINDSARFSGGSRILRSDLDSKGFELMSHSNAVRANKRGH